MREQQLVPAAREHRHCKEHQGCSSSGRFRKKPIDTSDNVLQHIYNRMVELAFILRKTDKNTTKF